MGAHETVSAVLGEITPERVDDLVRDLAAGQSAADGATISLAALIQALVQGRDLGTGTERFRALIRIEQAIMETLQSLPRVRYVEGDT